jgi:hypothetical protein
VRLLIPDVPVEIAAAADINDDEIFILALLQFFIEVMDQFFGDGEGLTSFLALRVGRKANDLCDFMTS